MSTAPASASTPVTPQRIMEMMWAFAAPLTMEAAVRLNVFDTLDEGPKNIEQIARDTGASLRGLKAILNTLVAFQFLAKDGDAYGLTAESAAFLVSSKPGFQGGILRHISSQLIPNWLSLTEIARTGKAVESVNQEGPGSAFFTELVESIYPMSAAAAGVVAQYLSANFPKDLNVLDLAAGSGVWGIELAKKLPRVRVTAVDWERVIPITRRVAEKHGVADRFKFVAGDLLTADFGTGNHVATLGHILHSEGEDRSRALLKRVFAALAPGGTIVIGEFVPDEDRQGPAGPLIFAINMLVNTDFGDTFTFSEIGGWLGEAGFVNVRQLPAPAPSPLILADRPGA